MTRYMTAKRLIAGIVIGLFISAGPLSWADDAVFTEYPVTSFKIIEVYEDARTVLIETPYGESATVGIGDIVGEEEATVVDIQKGGIVLEEPDGESGIAIKSYIPVGPQGATLGG